MDKKITNIEVKKNNRNRVFRYICKNGTVSNPDISYDLKVSLPTVTQITKDLIKEGLVEESGEMQSTGGRRAKALSAAVDHRYAIGLDITGNHISMILTNLSGEILQYERVQQPYGPVDAYYPAICGLLEEFIRMCEIDTACILGIGISFPGIVDLEKRVIVNSHALNVESLPFDSISRYFPYPCYFFNDANSGAYAEGVRSEKNTRFFYLSLSNTVGGAVYDSRELVQGEHYRCGEVGHMTVVPDGRVCYCGKRGCLDAYCSARQLSETVGGKLETYFERLDGGDYLASVRWEEYLQHLAVAVNNLHMVLDCDIILGGYVGSYMAERMKKLRDKIAARNTFSEDGSFVKACSFKVEASALGAALHVIEGYMKEI